MLNNKALRESWVEDLTRLARDPEQKLSVLAKDVLIFMAFEEGPHEQIPDVTDDQQVKRWLVLADKVTANASPYAKAYFDFWKKYYSTDSEGRAMQAIRNQSTESDGPRNVWTPEKLQAFEAGLV